MKRIVKLTESDLTRIVKRMVNETKEKTDTKFNKKWVGMINTRLKNGNLNSALEMAENLNDEIGGMSNVVKHLKNAKSEIDRAKNKLNSLSESDLTRIVRRVIMEQQTIDSNVCDTKLGNRVIGKYYYDGEEDVFIPNDDVGSTYKEEIVGQWKGKLPSDLTFCK